MTTDGRPRSAWTARFAGMGPFNLIWLGQLVTMVGSGMTRFAFIVRLWTHGGSATQVALMAVFAFLPRMLLSPLAGALVDRWRRKTVLQLTDLGGLLAMSGVAVIFYFGSLEAWELYAAVVVLGAAESFQYPAFSSSVTALVSKDQLARANGMLSSARSAADICGPALGGLVVATAGLGPVLLADIATFVFAIVTIRVVAISDADRVPPESLPRLNIFADSIAGLRYIFARASLRSLGLVFFTINLAATFGFAMVPSMILARTGNNTSTLALVNVAAGVGGVGGGGLLAWWGGPKNRVAGMMWGIIATSIVGQVVMAVAHVRPLWMIADLVGSAIIPIVNGSLQTIIQRRVPREVQGRVFGGIIFIAQIAAPIGFGCSGPIADHILEPEAAHHTGLAGALAPIFGSGRGSGMAIILALGGVLGVVAAVAGLLNRSLRQIDTLLPEISTDEESPDAPVGAEAVVSEAQAFGGVALGGDEVSGGSGIPGSGISGDGDGDGDVPADAGDDLRESETSRR